MSEEKRTIMLGFHSPVDGRLLREWVTGLGYEVVESLDDTDEIDLVLMDSVTARRLMDKAFGLKRAAKYFLPVLVCINAGEDVGRWLKAGFDDVLRLPATKAEWQARIEIMLRLRRQSEGLVRKSEMLHQALVESSSDQIFMLDANGTYVASNDRVEHLGLERGDELVGKTIDQVYPKEVAPFYRTQLQRVLNEGEPVVFEHNLPSDQDTYHHLDTLYPVNLPDGTVMVGGICRDITERKRAEKQLHESERFARSTLNSLSAHIAILDADGVILAVNREWRRFAETNGPVLGNVCEGANYLAVCEAAQGDDQSIAREFAAGIHRVLIGEAQEFALEYPCHAPDKQRWFIGRVTRFAGEGPVRVVVSHENITERKQAEEAVRLNRERLNHLFTVNPAIVYALDPENFSTTWVSPNVTEVTGYTPEEARHPGLWAAHVHPEDREETKKAQERLKGEERVAHEYRFQKKDGRYIWVRDELRLLRDEQGRPKEIVGSWMNITGRKEAEIELAKSEQRYRSVFENTGTAMIIVNEDGAIAFANKQCTATTGYSPEELQGTDWRHYVFADDLPMMENYFRLGFTDPKKAPNRYEARLIHADGSTRNCVITADTMQPTRQIVVSMLDITERKLAEEKLKAANQQLRATEQQLIASNQELKKAVEELNIQNSKVTFLYNLSLSINKSLSIDEVVRQSLEKINSMIKPSMSFFFIKNNDELNLEQVCPSDKIKVFDGVKTHKVGECICGLSVTQNKALYSKNIFEDIRCTWDECKEAGLKSFAALPLRHDDKVIGVIGISSIEERDFEKESEFLETISGQISTALSKSKLLQNLKDNEARLKEAELIAQMGNFTWVIKTGDVTWSDGLHVMLGYDKSEKIDYNRVNAEIHHPDDLDRITAWLNECIASGKTSFPPNEYRLLRKDGKVMHVQTSVKVQYEDHVPLKMFGTVQDITERKQAEEALKEAQSNLHALLDNRKDSIWSLDQDYNYIVFNKPYVDVIYSNLGVRLEKGMNAFEIHPKEVNAFWKPKFDEVFKGKYVTFEFSHVLEGKEYFFEVYMNPIYTDNKVTGLSALSMDITGRKRAEEELKKYHEHLEELVKERTEELEAFAYSVSHDLRAPLRAINGFTRILMQDYVKKLDDEGKRLGSVIQKSAQKMGKLIDDLLAFSRLGRAAMQFSGIDMKNMANAIYHEATSSSERKRIKFSVADLPDAYGDSNMFRQVWMNLISNAVKFSSKREKAVISITGMQDDEKTTYRISDNGAGFDMQYVNKIFDVFQRLHREDEYAGTGVGLSLVQRIIHRHEGKIWAESELDKGATFYFSLPKKVD